MLLNGILYRKNQNTLQDAGDLDGQIIQDLRSARNNLHRYQRDHLDMNVKGSSSHYEQWSEENQKKIAWLDRMIEMAEKSCAGIPVEPAGRYVREEWDALRPNMQERIAAAMAKREAARIRKYLEGTVHVERQSGHPDDWYLWTAAARRDAPGHTWDCWTLNITTGSLNGGRYGLSYKDLVEAMLSKKGIKVCHPETCQYAQDPGQRTEETT